VTIVVTVLIINCQVSIFRNRKKLGNQSTTSSTHPMRKTAWLTKSAAAAANWSKGERE
jgi:hypothetical protein